MVSKKRLGNTARMAGIGALAAVTVAGGTYIASAAESNRQAGKVSVVCPSVADKLGAVPAAADKGVRQELANLQRQIDAVNARLAREPKAATNQLKDIAGKRRAVLDRIRQNIERVGGKAPKNLGNLAECKLADAATNAAGNAGGGASNAPTKAPGADLGVLTNNCADSKLTPHDGFQNGNRCVSTAFGEVGTAQNNPSLLITAAPARVKVNAAFTLKVSTRNLIRDRFLAAGKGGYYVESSVLSGGLVRGHFHTACRMLTSIREAPAPDPVPAFFVATEDNKGGAAPDEVTIQVPGMPSSGTAQCASWAGDGSHRIPMMERANQTPAFDTVRITVKK